MRPSRQLLKLLLAWATLGLVVAAAHIGGWETSALFSLLFWTYFVVLAAAALIDGLASRRAPELEVSRTLAPHLALGIRQFVEIAVINASPDHQHFWLTDFPPAQLMIDGLPVELHCAPAQRAVVRYHVTPLKRGIARFGQVCCRIRSRWRLWERNAYFGEPQRAKIYPNYKPLFRSSLINSEQTYGDWGVHLRQRRGDGTDFRQATTRDTTGSRIPG